MNRPGPSLELTQVLASLAEHLPDALEVLLQAPELEEGASALARLRESEWRRAAVASMPEEEASALAQVLLERWRQVGEVVLEPTAVVVGPAESWVAATPRLVTLEVEVAGLDPDWTASWSGEGIQSSKGSGATIALDPKSEREHTAIRVRIEGRRSDARVLTTATHRIAHRRPVVHLSDDRCTLTLMDQHGAVGAHVDVHLNGEPRQTDADGVLELESGLPAGSRLVVDGLDMGVR